MRPHHLASILEQAAAPSRATDPDAPMGVVTPSSWRSRCPYQKAVCLKLTPRVPPCKACGFCLQDAYVGINVEVATADRPQLQREPSEYLFPCVEAALACLVRSWDVPRGTPSPMGPMLDRVRLELPDGSGAHKPFSGAPEHLQVEDLAEVRRAFGRAYDRFPAAPSEVSIQTCQQVLVLAIVGRRVTVGAAALSPTSRLGMKGGRKRKHNEWGREPVKRPDIAEALAMRRQQVHDIVRWGRDTMTIDLAASEVIPWPRASRGLHDAIRTRIERGAVRLAKKGTQP